MRTHLIVAAGVAATAGVASANLLVNASFEDPALPGGTYASYATGQSIGAGWVVDSSDLVAAVITNGYTGGGATWHTTPAGNQYLYVGDSVLDTIVSQDVVLVGGTPHTLDFIQAAFIAPAINGRVYVDVLQGGVSILGGGETLFVVPAGSDFVPQNLAFTTTVSGAYSIKIRAEQGFVACVDDLILLPTPGTLALAGMAGLGLRRRSR